MTQIYLTQSDDFADDFAAESSEQSSPLADLTNAISRPMGSNHQCAPDVCGKRNRHALAIVLRLAADFIDGSAMAARKKSMRERGLPMENDYEVENRLPDEEAGNDLEDVLAPAKNLLSLLEGRKDQSIEVVGVIWEVR